MKKRGMTLLEIMIAFGILSLFIIPFLRAFVTTSKGVAKTGDYTRAVFLAQKVIEDIRYSAYNEDSRDFPDFLHTITDGQDGDDIRVAVDDGVGSATGESTVGVGTTGESTVGVGSAFFTNVFDSQNNPDDQTVIKQLEKFTVKVDFSNVKVNSDEESPDTAVVNVSVIWYDGAEESEENRRLVYMSTVITRVQQKRGPGAGGGG